MAYNDEPVRYGPRGRSRVPLRIAVAAAALALVGVGVGTAVAMSQTKPPTNPQAHQSAPPSASPSATPSADPSGSATPSCGDDCPTQTNTGGGHTIVTVPGVVHRSESDARHELQERGLNAKAKYLCDGHDDPGTVLAQNPYDGSKVSSGTTVNLDVQGAEVPDVTGTQLEYAKGQLKDKGFAYTVSYKTDNTAAKDTVLSTNPGGHTCAKWGSSVTITVARPPSSASASAKVKTP